jgi:hypothetical protein
MPYRPHSEYRSPYPPPAAAKDRPSAAWFAVGGVLLVVAAIVFGIGIARFVRTIAHTDAQFSGGGVHQVSVPAHTQRAVFVVGDQVAPRCVARDGSGTPVQFRRPNDRFTYQDWIAVRVFDTGDGHLIFTCAGRGGDVRIAQVPSGGDLASLGFLGILFPLALGGVGFLILLVTTILWISRRPNAPPPGAPPGWPAGQPPARPPSG